MKARDKEQPNTLTKMTDHQVQLNGEMDCDDNSDDELIKGKETAG